MVRNDDGLLNVPEALRDKKQKRALRMATLTKEDKMKAQLMLIQQRVFRQTEQQEQLQKEIAKEVLRQRGFSEREIVLEEVKQQY